MIRTGAQYRDSIRDGREVWMNGERVPDVSTHPMFAPIVDIRARIFDLAHDAATRDVMSYTDPDTGDRNCIANKLPRSQQDWQHKRVAIDLVQCAAGGVVTRVGDETVGEMWSLFDGQDMLNEVDPRFAENIRRHVQRAVQEDPFHVSANTDPKGDRSKAPKDQDPDMLLHVVRETDSGIVVRGAKYETAAAYSNQAFAKPTIANWGNSELSDYAVGFVLDMGIPRAEVHLPDRLCRPGASSRLPAGEPRRRGGVAGRVRRRRDPVGQRAVLPAHSRRRLHPRDLAPLQCLPVRPANPPPGRSHDRHGAVEREADRTRKAARRPGETRRAGLLP